MASVVERRPPNESKTKKRTLRVFMMKTSIHGIIARREDCSSDISNHFGAVLEMSAARANSIRDCWSHKLDFGIFGNFFPRVRMEVQERYFKSKIELRNLTHEKSVWTRPECSL